MLLPLPLEPSNGQERGCHARQQQRHQGGHQDALLPDRRPAIASGLRGCGTEDEVPGGQVGQHQTGQLHDQLGPRRDIAGEEEGGRRAGKG